MRRNPRLGGFGVQVPVHHDRLAIVVQQAQLHRPQPVLGQLAGRLGLHGTEFVVGWTAWLDLAPVGVSKASGLALVAERLGVAQADVLTEASVIGSISRR